MAGRDGGMVVAMRESALYIVSWRVVQRAGIRVVTRRNGSGRVESYSHCRMWEA
jgi:hypothetical protein